MDERITTCGIVMKEGRYLVGLRHTPGSDNDSRWEFIGGKNRYGESVADTLEREFMEELGVHVEVGRLLVQIDFVNRGVLYHLMAHEVRLLEEDFVLSVHSGVSYKTLDEIAEIAELDLVDSDRRIVEFLRS